MCRPATAELVLNFSADDGGNFGNAFDVKVGDRLSIGVYLQETSPDNVLITEGLVSWGFNLTRTSMDIGILSNVSADPVFDFANVDVNTGSGFELEYAQNTGLGVTGNSILLASFQFDAGGEGSSVFTIQDRLIGSGLENATWLTSAFSQLDEQIFGPGAADSFQFAVNATAVPEPSSYVLISCVASGAILRRRRSRSKSTT